MSDKVIDYNHIRQYTGDDDELIAEIFSLFKNQVEMWSRGMDAKSDDDSWSAVMHSLKGSANAVGAMELVELCAHGEGMVGGNKSEIRRLAHIDEVKFAIEQVMIEIARWEYKQRIDKIRS